MDNTSQQKRNLEKEADQIAREQVSSGMWNLNILILAYGVFIITVVLALRGISSEILGGFAFVGLVSIWFYGRLRYKKIYSNLFQNELKHLKELSQGINNTGSENSRTKPLPEKSLLGLTSSPLTLRQLEILTYISKGNSNKQVAAQLNLSEQTIKNQLRQIFKKLGVEDRTQAVLTVIRNGWISQPDVVKDEANVESEK